MKALPPYKGFEVFKHKGSGTWVARRYVLIQVSGARTKKEAVRQLRSMGRVTPTITS